MCRHAPLLCNGTGWVIVLAIIISMLALFATLYEAYLQRTHNRKSVRPLIQIDLGDHENKLYVYIRNNGLGPMIIDKLSFTKNGTPYAYIKDCLDIPSTSYMHVLVNDAAKRVVLPNAHLVVFEKAFGDHAQNTEIDLVRKQLTPITLKVNYRDIYDNKFTFVRDLNWFSRHVLSNEMSKSDKIHSH